jgi:iron complex outermembrane receptor protein
MAARPLRQVLLKALWGGVGSGLVLLSQSLFAQSADDPADELAAVELRTVTVTGTRIKRVDVEGALPVTIIDREMIELSGETSIQDLLRNLTFNSFGSYTSQFQGDMGTSQVDLRGLGSGRTLILVDGRRLPKAPVAPVTQSINAIPMGAVDRIEVLSDGASAIYGSDAIGGVINIITRKDYEGWELMYGRAQPQYGEGKRDEGTIMYGTGFGQSNLLINFSWNNRDISYDRDFAEYEPAENFFANNFRLTDPGTGFPTGGWTAFPGGCQDTDAFFLVPNPSSLTGEVCRYNWAAVAATETSEDTQGMFIKFEHEFNADWQLWVDAYATQVEAFGRFAPAIFWSFWTDFPMPTDSPNNPTNPESPMYDPLFGPNVPVHWVHRFEAMGFRDFTRENHMIDVQAGINAWLGSVELELGLRKTWNWTDADFLNWLNEGQVHALINDGSYNLQTPSATAEETLDRLRLNFYEEFRFDQEELFSALSWDLFETSAGPVQWVVGGEFRREEWSLEGYDQAFEGNFPYPLEIADRDTTSLFFETLVPLTTDFELSLAGRYDDYSDWGSEFSPKVSARWRVSDSLVTRASWGEGFRAPQLNLNTVEAVEYPWFTDEDPQSCAAIGEPEGCTIIFQATFTVSPELSAETSDQYSFGLVWEPADWFSQTIDYFNISTEDSIALYDLSEVYTLEQAGLPAPTGLGVRRDPSGLIQEIIFGWANYGLLETSGLDLNTKLSFEFGPGRWRTHLMYSHVFDFSTQNQGEPTGNLIGTPLFPEARGTLSNYYDIQDFTFAWNLQYTSEQRDLDAKYLAFDEEIPSWITHDVQVNYHAPWGGRITLGAQNVTGKSAPDSGYFTFYLYDFYGRVYYAQYIQTFQ